MTVLLLALLACRTASVVNACDEDDALCLTCANDAECAYGGNPCTETVYCAHEDAEVAVIEIGCSAALEYGWPAAETCACVEGACRSDE